MKRGENSVLSVLLIGFVFVIGCGGGKQSASMTKEQAARKAKTDISIDFCSLFGWYNDGVCDDFCLTPDPDCNSVVACYVGGCSGQLCTTSPGASSTCEFMEYYSCYQLSTAKCEARPSGTCGWSGDAAFTDCLFTNGACPLYSLPPDWWCDGGTFVDQEPDARGCPRPPACKRGEGATCGGEHEFQCDDGFDCVDGICQP